MEDSRKSRGFHKADQVPGASCSGFILRHFHALGEPSGEPLGGNLRKGGKERLRKGKSPIIDTCFFYKIIMVS